MLVRPLARFPIVRSPTARRVVALLLLAGCRCDGGEPLPDAANDGKSRGDAASARAEPPPAQTAPPTAPSAPLADTKAVRVTDTDESDSAEAQGVPTPPAGKTPAFDPATSVEVCDVEFHGKTVRSLASGPRTGRAVLLLHGARFNSRTWQELGTLAVLARKGFHAVAIDLPGYAQSADVVAKADDFLHEIVPLLALKQPVVVFPSMSGSFAFPFAVAHEDELAGLVPVAPVEIEKWAPKLKGSKLPTLLFWGEKDAVIPIAQADPLSAALPQMKRIVLRGADHPCYMDRPEEFHAGLLAFLAELDAKK